MTEWGMDRWKYFDITHRFHVVCNPTSVAKLEELIGLMSLEPGSAVLEIACGKSEMLGRMAEAYDIRGVGVDLSPYFIKDAKELKRQRVSGSNLEFVNVDCAEYHRENTKNFDLSRGIGASWIYDGHQGTLRTMTGMTRPGGIVTMGEPFFTEGPSPLYTLVSNLDDWDRYETLKWYAVDEFARNNPNDPDLPEIQARNAKAQEIFLRRGRELFGWVIYLFRNLV